MDTNVVLACLQSLSGRATHQSAIVLEHLATITLHLIAKDIVYTVVSEFFTTNGLRKFRTVYSLYKTSSQLQNRLDGLNAGRLVSKQARGCESSLDIYN